MIHIESRKVKVGKGLLQSFRTPKYIVIPMVRGLDQNVTELVKKGDYVLKGQLIAYLKKDKFPFYSSVSGEVIGFEERLIATGEKVRSVVIQNDMAERSKEEVGCSVITKEDFVDVIKNMGIVGMGGAGFPTYLKYQTEQKIKTLLVNAVECEPYISADLAVILKKGEAILQAIDQVMKFYQIEEGIIVVKKENKEAIQLFQQFIGTYLNIRLETVENYYPAGWERNLIQDVKHVTYDKLPIEQGIVVNNVSTMYAIYEALKYQKPLIERVVTFAGEGFQKPQNVLVKVGTSAQEVISSLVGYKRNKHLVFVVGGPMMGNSMPTDDVIITASVNSILVLPYQEEIVQTCMRCGKCIQVCPVHLCPVLIKDHVDSKEELRSLEVERCIGCGLCSYICPAKIAVRDYVARAKKKVKDGR